MTAYPGQSLSTAIATASRVSLLLVLTLLFPACSTMPAATDRPDTWAKPVQLEGVPNLYKVSDTLYRSAQPSTAGLMNLASNGILTVINLRTFHSNRSEIRGTGLRNERIRNQVWSPEEDDVLRFLSLVTDPRHAPVLVHCKYGSDRTGTMCAIYRIVVQGWTKDAAIEEITRGDFGFHTIFRNLPAWLEDMDVERIRRKMERLEPEPRRSRAKPET